jgi:hypothetical protein
VTHLPPCALLTPTDTHVTGIHTRAEAELPHGHQEAPGGQAACTRAVPQFDDDHSWAVRPQGQ